MTYISSPVFVNKTYRWGFAGRQLFLLLYIFSAFGFMLQSAELGDPEGPQIPRYLLMALIARLADQRNRILKSSYIETNWKLGSPRGKVISYLENFCIVVPLLLHSGVKKENCSELLCRSCLFSSLDGFSMCMYVWPAQFIHKCRVAFLKGPRISNA